MAARNPDAAINSDPNGFMPSKPKEDNRIDTSGHKPGVLGMSDMKVIINMKYRLTLAVGNDAKPEFHLQTLPAGTAPPDK